MRNIIAIYTIFLFFVISSSNLYAVDENEKKVDEVISEVNASEEIPLVNQDEVLIKVNGVVCSFCAKGVSKKISKLKFIDKSKYKKGVFVDIKNQKVNIAVKPGMDFELEKVLKSIIDGGYEPTFAYTNLGDEGIKIHKLGG